MKVTLEKVLKMQTYLVALENIDPFGWENTQRAMFLPCSVSEFSTCCTPMWFQYNCYKY